MATSALKALKGKDLLEFTSKPGSARTSVIVEARRPPVGSWALKTGKSTMVAAKVTPSKPRPQVKPEMGAVESVLKRLGLTGKARRNDLAGSFVVEVTPQQLVELADSPSIQAIRPNRFHRRVATA